MGCATRTEKDVVGNPLEYRLAGIERQQYDDWRADYTAEHFGDFPAQDFGDFGYPGGADSIPVFNPDTGQWEAKTFEETWHKYHAQTVFAQTTFGQSANAGTEERWAHGDHRHGTPPNRYPETGSSYFSMQSPYFGATGCGILVNNPFRPGVVDGSGSRINLTAAVPVTGYGQPVLSLNSISDGTAYAYLYNDYDVNGNYGVGSANRRSLLEVKIGDMKAESFIVSSAEASKANVSPLDSGRAAMRALQPVSFDRGSRHQFGLVAEAVEAVIPEAVVRTTSPPIPRRPLDDGKAPPLDEADDADTAGIGIDYAVVVAVLLRSVQELDAEVERLKAGRP